MRELLDGRNEIGAPVLASDESVTESPTRGETEEQSDSLVGKKEIGSPRAAASDRMLDEAGPGPAPSTEEAIYRSWLPFESAARGYSNSVKEVCARDDVERMARFGLTKEKVSK